MRFQSLSGVPAMAVAVLLGVAIAGPAAAQSNGAAPVYTPRDSIAAAIAEASRRFGVPSEWIVAVVRVESGGDARAVSRAGAIGLMQVMPATYAELRRDLGLGADPFAIRDNILAGTAYMRRMLDRYGSPGFLAAYNAGPGRWEAHLAGTRPLPAETIRYVQRLAQISGPGLSKSLPVASQTPPPSPFTAPLFVARHVDRPPAALPQERDRIVAILVANTTVVPQSNGLFAGGSTGSNSPRNGASGGADHAAVSAPADTLFVARTQSRTPR
ncbi:MAG: hypothetical protein B7Y43_12130 [Sphingomonas sp. 28-62-20]|uniref:lytic transglycosylase domain-containing protein n=1 Tax=Sphingomonas sp. 28-62-20 TaxID=1970433 RepID=UPI000BDD31AB|nr:MAG: hypothetical protein B7Y43_12130 [Sphingomonas sp. 28-62-20]